MRNFQLFCIAAGAALMLSVASAPATAGTFDPANSVMGVSLGALPPITTSGLGGVATWDGSALIEPSGIWAAAGSVGTTIFTGVPLITNLLYSFSNASGSMVTGAVLSNPVGTIGLSGIAGLAGLNGSITINAVGGYVMIPVPLAVQGVGGVFTLTALGYTLTITGAGWGLVANVTGITETTPSGAVVNTVTRVGGITTTPTNNAGTITLVSPFRVKTGPLAGSLSGFVTKTFAFAPEPATLLLMGSGIAGLAILGRKRARS